MLETQPFYLTGIEDSEEAKKNALGAMGLFMVTLAYNMYKIYFPDEEKAEEAVDGPEGYRLNAGATEYGSY